MTKGDGGRFVFSKITIGRVKLIITGHPDDRYMAPPRPHQRQDEDIYLIVRNRLCARVYLVFLVPGINPSIIEASVFISACLLDQLYN